MSWSNVFGIAKLQFWGESNSDSQTNNQVHLFVNGRHQVRLFAGISFAKYNEADATLPTEQEVLNALCLINNSTGGSLQHLTTGKKGSYTSVHSPSQVHSTLQATNNLLKSSVLYSANGEGKNGQPCTVTANSGDFQFIAEFYVSSDPSKNSNNTNETVSVKLNYKDYTGTSYTADMSANSQYYTHASVNVNCYRANQFSNKIELTKDGSSAEFSDPATGSDYSRLDHKATLFRLHFAGGYFYISHYENLDYADMKGVYGMGSQGLQISPTLAVGYGRWNNSTAYYTDVYCATDMTKMGKRQYIFRAYQWRNSVNYLYDTNKFIEVRVYQNANEIVFIATSMTQVGEKAWEINMSDEPRYVIYDQFGNNYTVVMGRDWNGAYLSPIISHIS